MLYNGTARPRTQNNNLRTVGNNIDTNTSQSYCLESFVSTRARYYRCIVFVHRYRVGHTVKGRFKDNDCTVENVSCGRYFVMVIDGTWTGKSKSSGVFRNV